MNAKEIQRMQRKIGVEPDGFWGPKSIAACQRYLMQRMPKPHPFPAANRVQAFFGPHGEPGGFEPPMKEIVLPFPVFYGAHALRKLRAHERCADSLQRVFERLHHMFPSEPEKRAAGILTFDGLYNPRRMRGGTAWSMHAWAIAIDLDARRNGLKSHWPKLASMPLEVMECFAAEGWTAAGAFWSCDAMHFQATKP